MDLAVIVSFYANITKIGIRSYHCRFTQSKADKESHVAVLKKYFNLVLQMPNTIITGEIVRIKITLSKRPLSAFPFTERQ